MKKFLSCLLAVLLVSVLFVVSAGATVGDEYKNFGEVAMTIGENIRLDAEMDAAYNKATPIEIKYAHYSYSNGAPGGPATSGRFEGIAAGQPVPENVAHGTAYVVYDGRYLWVYVNVVDSTLNTHAADALSSSFKQDSVEFMMDWTNEAADSATTILQARMSHEGYISARAGGPSGTSLFGSVDDGGPNPVTWLNGYAKHNDTGYACEFRIEVPADFDQEYFSMSLLINDYDETGDLSSRVMITADDVKASGQWLGSVYGYMKFDYKNNQPSTGDMTVVAIAVAMVLALGLATVTVVSMKKKAR